MEDSKVSDTPKYFGLADSESDGELWFSEFPGKEHPTRDEFDAYVNAEVKRITEDLELTGVTTPELYIRERDTRRQFSPEQLAQLRDKLWQDFEIQLTDKQTSLVVEIILEQFRKLIHEP